MGSQERTSGSAGRSERDFLVAIGASPGAGDAFAVSRNGMTFEGRALRGKGRALLSVSFRATFEAKVTAAPIVLRRERWVDRLGKRLGINREWRAGDAAFDDAVYVEADAPDATIARIFSSDELRAATVAAIATQAIRSVTITADGALVYCVPAGMLSRAPGVLAALDTAATMARVLAGIGKGAGLRGGGPLVIEPALPTRRIAGWAFLVYMVAIWLVTGTLSIPPTVGSALERLGLLVGLGLWVPHVFVTAAVFRGRSGSLRTVLLFGSMLLLTCGLGGMRVALWVNAARDNGPLTTMPCRIEVKHWSNGSPYVVARLDGVGSMLLDISPLQAFGDPKCTVGKGALGQPWIA